DVPSGQFAPIMTPLSALPIDLPAFLPQGFKAPADGEYTFVSQPTSASPTAKEAKDLGDGRTVRFAHKVKQGVGAPDARAMKAIPAAFAKGGEPVVAVELKDRDKTVVQLWQKGSPWPLYTDNGRTKAKLVSVGEARE